MFPIIKTAILVAILATPGAGQETDDNSHIVKVTAHHKPSFQELLDMIDIAEKRNLRGQVSINDLTNCKPDDKDSENKKKPIHHMREKTTTLLYTYDSEDKE